MQVTEAGEVIVGDESTNSSPTDSNTLRLDEPFAEVQHPAHTHHPAWPFSAAAAAAAAPAVQSDSGARSEEAVAVAVLDSAELQPPEPPAEGTVAGAYSAVEPMSLPAILPRVSPGRESSTEASGPPDEEAPEGQSLLRKRRFSDSCLGGEKVKLSLIHI